MSAQNLSGLESYLDTEERDARKIQSGSLRRLIADILRHRVPLLGGVVMVVIGTGAALLEPRLFGYAIDEAIVPKKWELLKKLTILFFFVTSVRVVAAMTQGYWFEVLGQRVTQDLRMRLFSHLQRLPISLFDKNPAGRLLTRVTNDISALNEMFSAGFVSMLSNILLVAGILIWLLILDLRLGLIAASVFPILILVSIEFSRRLKVAYRDARSKLSALNAFLAENILGMKVVHLFNRRRLHLERFDRVNQWYTDAQVASIRVFALFQPAITISAGISMALVIWFGGQATYDGTLKVGILFSYFSFVLSLFQPVREIADKWNIFLSGMASAERVFSILNWPTELPLQDTETPAKGIHGLRGHIVFENVWFAYDAEHWVLRDFTLELKAGQKIGIVGHTGAGKTTLISLLMRFYEPQKGRILLDGRDLREYDKRELRASIGIVQQDVFLFSGSLRDNIDFWGAQPGPLPQMVDLRGVGGAVGGQSFDSENSKILLERGSNLSVGQRQVVAFARAQAARPQIWILDEATANIDSGTEVLIQAALEHESRGHTAILIAHRLATVRDADQIIVLNKGVLVEKGKHDQLVQMNGLYARLYRYQQAQAETLAAGSSRHSTSVERDLSK